ncbi:MAG: Fic family protein [Halobacteriovoraceae bacterium]|nr:Fic family protein [Halobacteriovoraceae bacterium]
MKVKSEEGLNLIRENSREISKELGLEKAFKKLDQIIGALLSTKESSILRSSEGKKRAEGRPFDVNCISKLEILFGELRTSVFEHRIEKSNTNEHFVNKAFFESYFSNYIEGTTFEIEEAEEIIFDKKIIESRPKDSHDILGVFNIVSDREEMKRTPNSFQELIEIIQRRHFIMMKERPEVEPGKFKEKKNKAGNTTFVDPDYVIGTLEKGFEIYSSLKEVQAKAIFISYLISEVHPFNDGNGRLCRIMFNSELAKAGLSTLIIPTVYREDYLLSLRALSRRERAKPLIKMFTRALRFSNLDFSNYSKSLKYISDYNWFLEPSEGRIIEIL